MDTTSLGSETLERVRAALRDGPPLRLAVLFGSAARGSLRPGSDVDIAIVPVKTDLGLRAELDLQAALSRASGREVDLLRLDLAPTLVKWEVARSGRMLCASGPDEFARFVAEAASEYLDFAPAFQHASESFRRALAGERG